MRRRRFLFLLGALGAAAVGRVQARPRFERDPFALGVASGYPRPDGFVLWTRLAPEPLAPSGGMPPVPVPVHWEVAEDEGFRRVVARGSALAEPEWAHSLRVEPRGLAPSRWYWYRFRAGEAESPAGRTRTAPSGSANERLRFAFASCQQYEQGYYGAYRRMSEDDLDLVLFLGDYIYESSWGRDHVRRHEAGEPYTLEEYRARHALYRSDPDLQLAHRLHPWVLTWDDHEVDNDYANDRPEDGMPREQFLARRAAAYRAYYEHLPLPEAMRPHGPEMRIHTHLDWGALARICVLDGRQYRDPQVCPRRPGGSTVVDPRACPEIRDPARSLLGRAQEAWLEARLAESGARWNLIAQQTLMARLDRKPGEGEEYWTDGWDGYPAARARLLSFLAARRVANPVVLGGDVHMHWVAELKADFDDPQAPVVASEFCSTSVSSQAMSQRTVERLLAENPHLLYGRSDRRGYVRAVLRPESLTADLIGLESVRVRDPRAEVLARFTVEAGTPGPRRG